jgi:microcystin-dependent protein
MALPITIPNTFATATNNIPLSQLDTNFTTVSTAINGIGNGSEALANVSVTGGAINGAIIGGSNAVAGTFTTLAATTANLTTINATTINATNGGLAPTGSLTMWAGAVVSPPTGWLACNGANVSRSTYSALFAVVGTSFGIGDNSTTFGLPNLLNKFPIGAGDTYALAATGGSANATLVSHTHTATSVVTDPGHSHNYSIAANAGTGQNIPIRGTSPAETGTTASQVTGITVATTNSTEGSSATNANLPPYIAVGFIIKT